MESPVGCMESVAKRRHGITRQRVFLLRIDYIHHFVLIPYRRQAADFIHGFAVILRVAIPSYADMKKQIAIGGLFFISFFVGFEAKHVLLATLSRAGANSASAGFATRDAERLEVQLSSSPAGGAKKKDRFRTVFFLSNPKDWHVISPQVSM